jgi:hypothetical protein
MKSIEYDRSAASHLLPLLGSIGKEIQERSALLGELEARIESLTSLPFADPEELHELIARASAQRREIRLAKKELERLGCSVVGTQPLTFRIPGRVGEARHSFVWQTGDPALK